MKILVLLIFALATSAFSSQSWARQTPRDAMLESQRQERDSLLLRKPITGNDNSSTRAATLKQINDDFKELQVQNNKMMQGLDGPTMDYKSIEHAVSSLSGRAYRLKQNLWLPKGETGLATKRISGKFENEEEIKQSIRLLDHAVVSFTTNPLFKAANVVDVELGRKASRDLDVIIDLSKNLRKVLANR